MEEYEKLIQETLKIRIDQIIASIMYITPNIVDYSTDTCIKAQRTIINDDVVKRLQNELVRIEMLKPPKPIMIHITT